MSETKITEGPYFVHDFTDPLINSAPSVRDIYVSCVWPDHIAMCSMEMGLTGTMEEARANAHLFAASWDLLQFARAELAAIERSIEATKELSAQIHLPWNTLPLVARRDEIAALIAKAEGRQDSAQLEAAR